ncbi:hypothetical protein S7335_4981 [Synechococcus sp. PCC 7335]|uniref:hypothetical protein n=1 Tax=Synechococcus sp. (strain ATCC 29403 / PCC 7335) TaxID=91464 RepID=UPI00017EBC13|nr:hypothetical protein [Synechococcus sp. PCC 7335]EDX87273.1 hypothetical protein S7335_4981 [Synechococcus sp. PCC 7335]
MKLFSRLSATVAIAATALLAVPFTAQAQTFPNDSYIGIGGSEDGLVINGKLSIVDNLSVRPSIATDFNFDDDEDVSYLVPITYDFSVGAGRATFEPFVGAGIGGELGGDGDDDAIDFALVAGTDYRFARNYVANGSINYKPFAGDEEVGFTAGIGYLF